MSIHFYQSNGLWRSDWFYTELNIPKPVQLKSWSSTVHVLTPLNHLKCPHDSIFFTVDDDRIEFPQSGCPFPLRVTSGRGCWGIQTHSHIHLAPISHSAHKRASDHFSESKNSKNTLLEKPNVWVEYFLTFIHGDVFFPLWNLLFI